MLRRTASLFCLFALGAQARADGGIFVGSTPCNAIVRTFLGIPAGDCDVVRWELSLGLDARNAAPGPGAVQVEYGVYGKKLRKLGRSFKWENGVGVANRKDANIVELRRGKAALALWKINDETLYFLDSRKRPLVGDANFSYALSFAVIDKLKAAAEPSIDPARKFVPLATGPKVFGVYEGRTPCDVSLTLKLDAPADCGKVRWRLTLFQDAKSRALTNYRLESALLSGAREGAVSHLDGTPFDPLAKVLKLEGAGSQEPVYLLRADDDVLLFLDSTGKLGLGNRDFNYVLNRRKT